jgi:type VI secretion system protein ImpL
MVEKLSLVFYSRWFRTLLGVLALSLLIWFFGPLIGIGQAHPFDSELVRIIAVVALLVVWLVMNLMHALHAARKDRSIAQEVVSAPDADTTASAEEVAALRSKLKDALNSLKKARLGGKRLYQLPWYMFIGPPGAGKTTALANSGLQFPLAEKAGAQALQGVGGTRNCDWWFTDQAVLIDTAGRYTTQDSNAAVDASAWTGFLRMLKKHRGRQPLNGVLLAISLSDLSQLSEGERLAHAHAMRKRVRELHDELGVRIPIYVMFTKADLIVGFTEFFETMAREERDQVWGMTFVVDRGADEGGAVANFGGEFDGLLARLNDRMLERVNQETDIARRRLIYGFPQQVASLREVARSFLEEIFRPSRLETRPLLRGVYLTSGTQDGTPIDRLLGTMASQFGLQRQAVTAFSGAGRSYFLGRLMREVVFGEAGLVSTDPKLEARARWAYRGAYAAAGLCVLGATGAWTASYFGNLDLISKVHDEAQKYNADYKTLSDRGPQDVDLAPALPPLNDLRTMHGGYEEREHATPIALTFGLYQGNKLTQASIDAYYRALDGILLPRLLARLEQQMSAHMDNPDFLYSALKVYLILGRQGPLDAALIEQWMQADLASVRRGNGAFPGDEDEADRDALLAHIYALLDRPLPAVPLNGPLVAQVRAVLTAEPLAQYSYSRIMRSKRMRELPVWTVADNAGPGAARVFMLRSGKPLTSGVPGAYTWPGYHNVFLPLLPTVTQDIAEDGWVLGIPDRGVAATLAETTKLRRDVLGLYLDDYVKQWDVLIADVAIKPFSNVSTGTDELNLLSAPDSPFRDLMQAIDLETYLSRTGAGDKAASGAEAKLQKFSTKMAGFAKTQARMGLSLKDTQVADILGESFGSDPSTGKPVDPATRVDAHFRWIHNFVNGADGGSPPMEAAISKFGAMYQNLAGVANAANPNAALLSKVAGGGGGSPDTQLAGLAKDLPKPVAAMLQTVSSSGAAVESSGASHQLEEDWRSKVLPLCQEAFNRYPFVSGSAADVPRDDFARLLGPSGLMDSFFNDNLKSLVDTSSSPWHWQSADHVQLGLQQSTLTQFENASKIRDALFSAGSEMSVKFELVPDHLDNRLAKVIVDISGQTMTFDHGPSDSQSFTWPSNGKSSVKVTMIAAAGGHETIIQKDGPWALLRLLDAARVIPSGQPDKFELVFASPSGSASFVLNASSVRNPFTLSAFRSFRCPARL